MSIRLTSDPAESLRRIEKILLMLRYVWRFPRIKGAWPKYEFLKPWLADLRPATVVDVGVNHGQFLHLARRLWPDAKIVGIEPNAAIAAKMAGLYRGDDKVRIEACAVADSEGDIEFYVTRDDQSSSILAPTESYYDDREGDRIERVEKVPLRRLEPLLDGCDGPMLVKVDVQGAELAALKGMGARLADADVLIVEAPFEHGYEGASGFDDLYAFLTANGFAYEGAIGQLFSKKTGKVRQEDSIYVRRKAD